MPELSQETIELLIDLVKSKYSEYKGDWFVSETERKTNDIYIQKYEKALEELKNISK